jgi:hypothetical protein
MPTLRTTRDYARHRRAEVQHARDPNARVIACALWVTGERRDRRFGDELGG